MKMVMKRANIALLGIAALSLFLAGCAGTSQYVKETPATTVSYKAEKGQALVVFMRPSGLGFAISSSVFDLSDKEENLVGIVPAKKQVVYRTNPGEHMFMVVGESADFMKANLQEGKTYYALVTPRMGMWKARFSLRPVTREELTSDEFRGWLSSCELVENMASSQEWAKGNAASIKSKRMEYIIKWNEKADSDKPVLRPEDGQ